ncbi:MAG: PIN domain-containing protein [Saprospiraceae bacterium]|jgi:predicted nucleic acid-binding protein
MKVVVDSNIIFSALLRSPNRYCDAIFLSGDEFYTPKFMFVELFKYRTRIVEQSRLSEEEVLEMLYRLILNVHFFDESLISTRNFLQAFQLVKETDRKDLVFVALTIEIQAKLWTSDQVLKNGLIEKGFNEFYGP